MEFQEGEACVAHRAKKKSIIIITYTSAVRDLSQILETISILESVVILLDPLRSFTKMAKVQKQTWRDFPLKQIFSHRIFSPSGSCLMCSGPNRIGFLLGKLYLTVKLGHDCKGTHMVLSVSKSMASPLNIMELRKSEWDFTCCHQPLTSR